MSRLSMQKNTQTSQPFVNKDWGINDFLGHGMRITGNLLDKYMLMVQHSQLRTAFFPVSSGYYKSHGLVTPS